MSLAASHHQPMRAVARGVPPGGQHQPRDQDGQQPRPPVPLLHAPDRSDPSLPSQPTPPPKWHPDQKKANEGHNSKVLSHRSTKRLLSCSEQKSPYNPVFCLQLLLWFYFVKSVLVHMLGCVCTDPQKIRLIFISLYRGFQRTHKRVRTRTHSVYAWVGSNPVPLRSPAGIVSSPLANNGLSLVHYGESPFPLFLKRGRAPTPGPLHPGLGSFGSSTYS